MIYVTSFTGKRYVVNAKLIEFIEETPDTVISLTTGRKILVKESSKELVDQIIQYHRRIYHDPPVINNTDNEDSKK